YGKEFIEKDYGESYEIYTAYGACFLANRKLVNKLGLFDPEYFAYFEETDFSHRVWLSGHKVKIYTKAVIYHKGAKTAQKLPSSFIQYHSFKNRLFTYLKNFGLVNIYKIFVPHLFICEVSSVLYLAMRRPGYTLAIQKAILWNIIKVGKLLRERRKVQEEIRKVRDA
ncbi:MAG: Glycosyltransferase domain containing protein, partial [Candidatus Levybacteria bacterium GW2011_GWB1_36_18]